MGPATTKIPSPANKKKFRQSQQRYLLSIASYRRWSLRRSSPAANEVRDVRVLSGPLWIGPQSSSFSS